MTLHRVIVYFNEDTELFEWYDWELNMNEAFALNDDALLTDEEYAILTAPDPKQILLESKCRGYKPKEEEK